MLPRITSARVLRSGGKSFRDDRALILCDVATAGTAEIEYGGWVRFHGGATEIARHEPAEVFSQRNTQVAGAFAGAALNLRIECNLGP